MPELGVIIFSLFGGLALFIFGMQRMGSSLQKIAGNKMRSVLRVLTSVPVIGTLVGVAVTAIVQSSSLTTVMTVGFVNSGLLTLKQAISVIMGANIGTTVTGQMISFNVTQYSLLIIAVGFIIYFACKKKSVKEVGNTIFSLGLLFFGLVTMSDAMMPLREYAGFRDFIILFSDYKILGVLVGFLLTAILQSSSACIGILIAMASQGILPLEAALPILMGDNIGTCVTSLLASIGTTLSAKRAALAHLMFNVFGTILFMLLLPVFQQVVLSISPVGNVARQIANAHTLFNVTNTIILLPFISLYTKLITKLMPGEEKVLNKGPIYLDWHMENNPDIAVELASRELDRMGHLAADNFDDSVEAFINKDEEKIKRVIEMEEVIDNLEKEINLYLIKVSQKGMSEALSLKHTGIMHAAGDIERVSDHADNIAHMTTMAIDQGLQFSDTAIDEIRTMHRLSSDNFRMAVEALRTGDENLTGQVAENEKDIDAMEKRLRKSHIKRLTDGLCSPPSGILFLDLLSNFERVGDHAINLVDIVRDDF